MRNSITLSMAAAIMGLFTDTLGRRARSPLFGALASGIKPRTWHDPARKAAADERQAKRRERNLRQAQIGAYGQNWMGK